ncbi:bifunctional [glutamate--ammonia ligase]-adenylyl-L-tyrosine phosphorylase/[glutamate--ammonia-ligase] adenylyltransferase [Bermanella marisrubri]|uniref:Bifunctional glutamine synthetase adenylyltransferase/adenylyl-removing enzyme n=1 Tax=Bermanella marisrubri TaxID=207949 RepID=Q1N2E6_9GAMM|nr:bifunctional [glutamate--ammonia ligase]-adenylyl-L-tyrosine phosphorylase/[glutamate--ammonia-ligase] adenylyltransferase [Bermanella marisrubri]EAT12461.1 Glutamate-ammonia-ligase adenylyltransferase [Oceanobacter sp. RED65] [Bermanella marisrubri]QIZ85539.1 bifunctional [glutamate--ammonia ligase]-adenylyl-L-tyrosine phosphorylase/[glutamate--ammonia-ligase] adenylyltransferase [Bermanella marisrubri]
MWSQMLPSDFLEQRQTQLKALTDEHNIPQDVINKDDITKTLYISDFVFDACQRFPSDAINAFNTEFLHDDLNYSELHSSLAYLLKNCASEDELHKALRQFRRQHQIRLIHRDLNRLTKLSTLLSEITMLADVSIRCSLEWLQDKLIKRYGQPTGKDSGEAQSLIVIAMGKQGAGELNLSSDIDLIFAYSESGDTQTSSDSQRSISNQEFFTKLGQSLIQSLDKITMDGFVYRVDMRLRPYGQSGPLAMNFNSLENYYHDQGREWERYAMIKARAITGSPEHIDSLMEILRPFSYRKYVDFGAFESLRDMKNLIKQETIRRKLDTNVKLGSGGIREVEFIAQAFQLIRGGQEIDLQQPNIFKVYSYLKDNGYLPMDAVDELLNAYVFLRNVEHGIQALKDEQSQTLPDNQIDQQRLAIYLGLDSWQSVLDQLQEHRAQVSKHFANIVAEEEEQESDPETERWQSIWLNDSEEQHDANSEKVQTLLQRLRDQSEHKMQAIGIQRLNKTMPLLLHEIWKLDHPITTLERIIPLIEAILRRTAYLVLLTENPNALKQLVRLCEASPFIAHSISESPILLDELLHPSHLYSPSDKADLQADIRQRLLRIDELDLEEQMDALRHFNKAHKLQIAASDITGVLPLMKVSDHLTWIAETVLETALSLAWAQMVEKYGYPTNASGEAVHSPEFVVLGYGKMGGIELSYGSDLDLVFLHNATLNKYTTGKRELENGVFYTRLGQRLIHILNTTTRAGQLYEVDMRLRPSGASGMIVASLSAFTKYQHEEAWTWEHQALVRARVICGDNTLAQKFGQIRGEILTKSRNPQQLLQEVREMRKKMRDNLGSQSIGKNQVHLKQDAGGIVDIEFIVQYLVLAHCAQHPDLLTWTDNIRLLETLAADHIMTAEQSDDMIQAYIAYRSLAHRRALQNQKLLLEPNELSQAGLPTHIDTVKTLWTQIMDSAQ